MWKWMCHTQAVHRANTFISMSWNIFSNLNVKGGLFITAPSEAGRSQQAVDPVGDPTVEDEVSLSDSTAPIVNKDLSLLKAEATGSTRVHGPLSSFCLIFFCCTYNIIHPSTGERQWWTLQSPSWVQMDQTFSVNLRTETQTVRSSNPTSSFVLLHSWEWRESLWDTNWGVDKHVYFVTF